MIEKYLQQNRNQEKDLREYLPIVTRIVEWAQRQHRKVQDLTVKELIAASKS